MGPLIQATGRIDVDDSLRIRNQFENRNSLERVFAIPEVNISGSGSLLGGPIFNSTKIYKIRSV